MDFVKTGHGPVVVLSHALGLDKSMWSEVASLLSRECTVICYDHRGHGQAPKNPGPLSIDDLADDAAQLIRQVSDAPVVFAGLSLGGMVGQALAAREPTLLRGLAIINSSAHYSDRSGWDTRIQLVREHGIQAIADSSIERWLTPAFRETSAGKAVKEQLLGVLLRTDPVAYAHACEAIANMDLRAGNRHIRTPTLIIGGRQDMATPLTMSREIADAIANSKLVEVDAAHISAVELPEEVASQLSRWISHLNS